jgi:hypothetical protein
VGHRRGISFPNSPRAPARATASRARSSRSATRSSRSFVSERRAARIRRIRALKNEGVEVAGADRLVLTEHIAVMDLMALADALLLPHDDLALASVLRSPLFGFSDQELFDIASDRGRKTLRNGAGRNSGERNSPRPADALTTLATDGAARDAVCVLCSRPRRGRRAAAFPGAAWPRSQRCARRIPQPCAGLRTA